MLARTKTFCFRFALYFACGATTAGAIPKPAVFRLTDEQLMLNRKENMPDWSDMCNSNVNFVLKQVRATFRPVPPYKLSLAHFSD